VQEAAACSGVDDGHTYIRQLMDSLASRLPSCRSENTNRKYYSSFSRWKQFADSHRWCPLPAQSIQVALYLTHLLDKDASAAVVQSAMYAIKWAHDLIGMKDPTAHAFVKNLVESAKRCVQTPGNKKDPITAEILIELCDIYKNSQDLLVVRDLAMILLGFSGFLRFDEFISLRCSDVSVQSDHLVVTIRKSKTDQYRHGNRLVISKGITSACPHAMFVRYSQLAQLDPSSDDFLFKQVFRSGYTCKLIYKHKPLSYTGTRQAILKRLNLVSRGLDIGLHSLRSGGATAAASKGVNDRCLKRHGRWKSDASKDRYIEDSVAKRKEVSQNLGI
jgi:integrase